MKVTVTIALCALSLAACGAVAQTAAGDLAEAEVAPAALPVGTCINIGNTLETMQEADWGGEKVGPKDFERIRAAGFETVRIPVRWHNKTLQQAPWTVDEAWMDRVQTVVDQALAADLNVILNSHHFDPIHEDPLAVAEWHGAVWAQIADRFEGYPEETLWFELENEPHDNFDHTNLLETLTPALEAVRAKHPTRAVIIGGENWSGVDSLADLPLPDDPNIHPTFHYYEPFAFTHQGASWVAPDMPPPGRDFPVAGDLERIAKDAQKVRAYIERTGKTPFMGETGAYDKHATTAQRAAYHAAVTDAFAPMGVGMCMWAYANTYPFWDRKSGEWLPGMRAAIGLPETDQ